MISLRDFEQAMCKKWNEQDSKEKAELVQRNKKLQASIEGAKKELTKLDDQL